MTAITNKKIDTGSLIKWLIILIVFAAIMFVPETETFTFAMKWFFSTTAVCLLVMAFELMPLAAPAVAMPLLWSIPGIIPWETSFSGWANNIFWLMWGSFLLGEAVDQCGFMRRIALWCVNKCGGTYNGIVWGMFFAGLVLNMLMSGSGSAIILILACSLVKTLQLERKTANILIVVSCTVAVGFIYDLWFSPLSLTVFTQAIQAHVPDYSFYWYDMILWKLPNWILVFGFIIGMMKVFKTKNIALQGGKEYFEAELAKMGKMSIPEKKAAVILIALIAYVLSTPLTGLNINYGFIVAALVCFLPGISLADEQIFKRLNFSLLIFIASCLGIAGAATYCGATQLMASACASVLGNFGAIGTTWATLLMGVIANFVLTPVAMQLIFPDILVQTALNMGINPMPVLYAMNFSCDILFLPYEAGMYLMVMGFGVMSMKDFIKWMGMKAVVFSLFFMLVVFPLWYILGLYAPLL